MNVLIIGSGGREHAIALKIAESSKVKEVFIAPGNDGMSLYKKLSIINIDISDHSKVLSFCKEISIDLVIVGPEIPLCDGIIDYLQSNNIKCFGPNKIASQIESSKISTKKILKQANVLTAQYKEFNNAKDAIDFVRKNPYKNGVVVKADGLAAGKGVIVTSSIKQAEIAIASLVSENYYLEGNKKIIIEERISGPEVSAFALVNDDFFITIGHACDYKRIRDNNLGPNTGGMGTYSPVPWLNKNDKTLIDQQIFAPFIKQMKKNGIKYQGVLFAGLMKTQKGFSVLEFNCRFGDPETQVLLPLIENDLIDLIEATMAKEEIQIRYKNLSAVHVIKAAYGYPGTEGVQVRKNDQIEFSNDLLSNDRTQLIFAGVKKNSADSLQTSGGRVLGLTGFGKDLNDARNIAYSNLENITFKGEQYRNDIAKIKY
jgi:phosphoribosylamine--glycine ligase